ncbi:MAG: HEAT repeat domain-containing protein [Planctomycetes bacterium]|nr:HEAT repeat domain-containing protein [Planctomycetota bacterium]
MRAARRILCGLFPLVSLAGLAVLVLAPENRGGTQPSADAVPEETLLSTSKEGGAPGSPPEPSREAGSGRAAGAEAVSAVAHVGSGTATARPRGQEELALARPAAPEVRESALLALFDNALGEGAPDEESLEAIEAQERAEAALESLRDPSLAPILARIAKDHPNAGHRTLAADVLADLEPASARAISEEMLRTESDAGARQFAASLLANLAPGSEGLAALREALARDSSTAVRETAALSLARLLGKDALPDLREASALESSPSVRRTIEMAISLAGN